MRDDAIAYDHLLEKRAEVAARAHSGHGVPVSDERLLIVDLDGARRAETVAEISARFFRSMASRPNGREALLDAVPDAYPWAKALPVDQRRAFLTEVLDAWNIDQQARVVIAWHRTAVVYADPELAAELKEPLDEDDYGPVGVE